MCEEQKICFTDSAGKNLFSIPDGSFHRLFYEDGEASCALCRRLDDTHAEIDGVTYSIREFARRMERNHINYVPA